MRVIKQNKKQKKPFKISFVKQEQKKLFFRKLIQLVIEISTVSVFCLSPEFFQFQSIGGAIPLLLLFYMYIVYLYKINL